MNTALLERSPSAPLQAPHEAHVLLVVQNQAARYALADVLLDAGFRLTMASSYGLAELLVGSAIGVDVMLTAQPARLMGEFGLAQLARAVRPDLPILVVDEETVSGHAVVDQITRMMRRWPMRDWAAPVMQ